MSKTTQVIIGIVVIIILIAGLGISGFNKARRMNEAVTAQWAQVENQLKRRFDLIPNLMETVKGFANQEKSIFLGIAEARKAYFSAPMWPRRPRRQVVWSRLSPGCCCSRSATRSSSPTRIS